MIRRLRLASGLVMFAYVTTHFVNHSLGLVSVQVMDRALEHIYQYWASLLGSVLLYGAFATHYSLALWALWLRRSLKMPFDEAVRVACNTAPAPALPAAIMTSGARAANSVAALPVAAASPAPQRASICRLRPSIQPKR